MIKEKNRNCLVILPELVLLLLISCQPRSTISTGPSNLILTDTPVASPSPQTAILTSTLSPLTLIPSQVTQTITTSPFTRPSPPPSSTLTPTASQASRICSPLAWETLPELWEIISDPYNPPPMGRDERHQGVDFSHYSRKGHKTIEGEPVQAVLAGRVVSVIEDRLPYGNMVMVETPSADLPASLRDVLGMAEGESLYLLYAHFGHAPLVKLGDPVVCGQVIGEVGMTGYHVVNPHLHLEARYGPPGVVFESMAFYTATATDQEMENYRRWRMSGEFQHFDPMILFSYK
jgi:murein DD-endopeptidase MepM/ murein hydrolase activator NlpD